MTDIENVAFRSTQLNVKERKFPFRLLKQFEDLFCGTLGKI